MLRLALSGIFAPVFGLTRVAVPTGPFFPSPPNSSQFTLGSKVAVWPASIGAGRVASVSEGTTIWGLNDQPWIENPKTTRQNTIFLSKSCVFMLVLPPVAT